MKYALIGCGRIASNHIKSALENGLEIVAVCDVLPERMNALLTKFGMQNNRNIHLYTDYREMLRETQPQLTAIATESGLHASIALDCLDFFTNVIIEKPMAMSILYADRIIQKAEESGLKVSVCHQNRFNIAVQELKHAVDMGRFGKISHGSINVRWNRGDDYYTQASWRGTWAFDGGCLMNQCIHGIDLLRWILGDEIDEVYGQIRKQTHPYLETEDVGMGLVSFKNGTIATIEGTTNVYPQNLEETLYVFGENGTVKLGGKSCNNINIWNFEDESDHDLKYKSFSEETRNVYGNGHSRLYADMIDAIQKNRAPYVDAQSGKNALELVLAIYKSQIEGSIVKLPLNDFAASNMYGRFNF